MATRGKGRRTLRRLGWGTLAVGLLGVAVLAGWREATLPQIDGARQAPGIRAATDIVRDAHGVPRIYAQHEADAHFALGYVHAQDRLWQMEVNRRLAAGRLSELFGAPGVDTDRFLRTLGVRRAAQTMYARYTPAEQAPFEAYAAGVNAFLAAHPHRIQLAPEFIMADAPAPEPWSPEDSVAWTLMLAWDLAGNWNAELTRLRLAMSGMDGQRIDALLPPGDSDAARPPVDYAKQLEEWGLAFEPLQAQLDELTRLSALRPNGLEGIGSNNWVLDGRHSASGKPLLANDPHLGLSTPSLWYLAGMSAPGLSVIGATLPGVPGVILGRTERIAWGFTNTGSDVQDLYIEALDPADPERYRTPTGWQSFQARTEVIKVKGGADVALRVRESRNGPIVSMGASPSATGVLPPNYAIALRWIALDPANRTGVAIGHLNRANDRDDFEQAMRKLHAPHQNVVYADVDGLIGFVAAGAVPIRRDDNPVRGRLPVPGWDALYEWEDVIPYADLPQEWAPARGWRATANERIAAPDYPFFLTDDWAPPFRAQRIAELITAASAHDLAGMQAMQRDEVSLLAREVLPRLLAAGPAGEREIRVLERMRKWSGTMTANAPEPAIFTLWWRELSQRLMRDNQLERLGYLRSRFILNVLADQDGASRWCGPSSPTTMANCETLIAQSLVAALDAGEARLGSDPLKWRYGDMHRVVAEHRPFGRVDWLSNWFSLGGAVGGDAFTVNAMSVSMRAGQQGADMVDLPVAHGPGLRAVYDLADLDRSRFMLNAGQSGNRFSTHYEDFTAPWLRGDGIALPLSRDKVTAGASGTLTLRPGS